MPGVHQSDQPGNCHYRAGQSCWELCRNMQRTLTSVCILFDVVGYTVCGEIVSRIKG